MKVLVVEDDRKIGPFLKHGLEAAAYSTTLVRTKSAAWGELIEGVFDAIVLDLSLPDGDGLDFLREARESGFTEPVLILSARDAVEDRVKGLNLGADDYLPKPFIAEEFLARVRSLLRRQGSRKSTVFEVRGLRLDLISRAVTVGKTSITLTVREFALLELFMQNQGRVLSRGLIAEKIWESRDDLDLNLLDVYMLRLRKKLEAPFGESFFKTVRGIGYQFA